MKHEHGMQPRIQNEKENAFIRYAGNYQFQFVIATYVKWSVYSGGVYTMYKLFINKNV